MDPSLRTLVLDALAVAAPDADPATIDPAINFRDQIEFDSVDYLKFAMELEKRLEIGIPEHDYPRLASLESCLDYLEERKVRAPAAR